MFAELLEPFIAGGVLTIRFNLKLPETLPPRAKRAALRVLSRSWNTYRNTKLQALQRTLTRSVFSLGDEGKDSNGPLSMRGCRTAANYRCMVASLKAFAHRAARPTSLSCKVEEARNLHEEHSQDGVLHFCDLKHFPCTAVPGAGGRAFKNFLEHVMPRMCVADATAKTRCTELKASMHVTHDFCLEHWLRRHRQSSPGHKGQCKKKFSKARGGTRKFTNTIYFFQAGFFQSPLKR